MHYHLPLFSFVLIVLTACGSNGGTSSTTTYYGETPYDYPQYQDILDNADLEQNDTTIKTAGNFSSYDSSDFYLDENSYWLTLTSAGENNNTQLRVNTDFNSGDTDFYRLIAEILPTSANDSINTDVEEQVIALLKIDNDAGYAPLLQITWDSGTRNDLSDSYWAVVNSEQCSEAESESDPESCFDYYHLSNYSSSSATKFGLLIEDNQLTVTVNDETSDINIMDISEWSDEAQYFTAGVSNPFVNGSSTVQFKTLTYNTNLPVANLSASATPSDNFDLLDWYLSVPIDNGEGDGYAKATSIKEEELDEGYEDEFFYTADDGGMVFKCPIEGAITSENTSYTRTELREMLRRGNTNISTQGVNKNNWVFSSTTDDAQNDAGGVDGVLEATVAINAVTTTGDSDQRGRVIIGQIHANDDEPIRLYYRLLPGHTKGSIYFAHEPRSGSEQWITIIGSQSNSGSQPSDGIELNEKFYYKIKVQGNLLIVTIKRDYKDDITKTWNMSGSGFDDEDQYMYFKAGVYNQNKSGNDDDFVQATFYYLENQHTGYSNN